MPSCSGLTDAVMPYAHPVLEVVGSQSLRILGLHLVDKIIELRNHLAVTFDCLRGISQMSALDKLASLSN